MYPLFQYSSFAFLSRQGHQNVSVSFTSLYCIIIVRPTIPPEYGNTRCIQINKTSDIIWDNG